MVNIGAEKMSKSLGNFMTVQAAAARVGGEAVRLFVIGTHYRSPLDFSPERLDESARALTRIYETLARADAAAAGAGGGRGPGRSGCARRIPRRDGRRPEHGARPWGSCSRRCG